MTVQLRTAAEAALPILRDASLMADEDGWQTFSSQAREAHQRLTEAIELEDSDNDLASDRAMDREQRDAYEDSVGS